MHERVLHGSISAYLLYATMTVWRCINPPHPIVSVCGLAISHFSSEPREYQMRKKINLTAARYLVILGCWWRSCSAPRRRHKLFCNTDVNDVDVTIHFRRQSSIIAIYLLCNGAVVAAGGKQSGNPAWLWVDRFNMRMELDETNVNY